MLNNLEPTPLVPPWPPRLPVGTGPDVTIDRRKFIGSSDAAPALNLSPWRTAVDLWLEKCGTLLPFEGNAATRWGKLLEPLLRQEYADLTGRSVRVPQKRIDHREVRFIACHPDGITDDGRLLELKTARTSEGWGEPGTDEIPEHYTIQVQHQLLVTQLPVADVAVLFGGSDFQVYEVRGDRELQDYIVEAEIEFWGFVESHTAPPIDYRAPGALAAVKRLYPGTNGLTVEADAGCLESRARIESAKELLEAATEGRDRALAQLLEFMGEAALLRFADGRALRRQLTSRREYVVAAREFMATRWVKA